MTNDKAPEVPYNGDNPSALADEIELALTKYGRGPDRRLLDGEVISFFEGELRLIARALRVYGPPRRKRRGF
jgi:hypothetical protein